MINQSCFRHSKQKINITLWSCLFLVPFITHGQKPYLASESFDPSPRNEERIRLAFYNVENLFDYFDDSLTIDEQFLPRGDHYWTKARYTEKQNKLAKTILAMGGWGAPELIGLCEVENRYVLESLTQFTQLKPLGYEIIHKDSRDARGIDVAAIYRPDRLKLLNYEFYVLNFPFDTASRTRDILHAVMEMPNRDTLHFFVNHWPSKFGGEFETQPKRMFAAQFVRSKADSLLRLNSNAHIVITGDFNDEPEEESMLNGLAVNTDINSLKSTDLFNLMYDLRFVTGTHSFENKWGILDQFVVSGNLLLKQSKTRIANRTAQIFDMDFLIMEGATGARRPFRTYQGPKYIGGYSDHLPIIMDLILDR
ncbi:endonuclease/exonuclease/phosphatase family protein [Roseivirga echinicomitans]|uniref:endonuclease/exonuclease/phosphatase family protein n=1 Tax=Roseivirga echinicomitans TaxID=296218 RepID=UPI000ABD63D8|nr:endonuclease [Roseivirga echinicomitans]